MLSGSNSLIDSRSQVRLILLWCISFVMNTEQGATWAFLDRRVQEILDMGQNINTVRNVGGAVFGGLSALAHVLHRVPETSKEDIDRLRQQYSQMNVNAQQNPSSGSSPSENDNNTKADDSKKAN